MYDYHEVQDHTVKHAIQTMFSRYMRRFGDHDYRFILTGRVGVPLGRFAFRFPDTSIYHRGRHSAHSTVYIETAGFESLAQLDQDAQDWLGCPFMLGDAQAVLVVKVFRRREQPLLPGGPRPPYAAVAALYERGNGPGVGRTVNLAPPAGPGVALDHGAEVLVPGVSARVRAPAVAPTCVISFGSAPIAHGPALQNACGLGVAPTGVGFPGAVACDGPGIPGYAIRIPASRLYHGVPPAACPGGMQPDPRIPDHANDWMLDLWEIVEGLSYRPW